MIFKVDDETDTQFCDSQIIDHLPNFQVSYSIDRLGVDDDRIKNNEIRHKLSYLYTFVFNRKSWLLYKTNPAKHKFTHQCVFIWFFKQSVAENTMNLHCSIENLPDLLIKQLASLFHFVPFVIFVV